MSSGIDGPARILCWIVLLAPLVGFLSSGLAAAFRLSWDERTTNRVSQASGVLTLLAGTGMLILMVVSGRSRVTVELGHWVSLPGHGFDFDFTFVFDEVTLPFLLLSLVLAGVVGAFTRIYLHREPGYRRFYLLFNAFVLGMTVSSIAGTIETLFAGWELVGLSSALLVGFFQDRPGPVQSGLHVWAVYRVADAAFLAGALTLHQFVGTGRFELLTAMEGPTGQVSVLTPHQALAAGSLLLLAAAGKSALVPFCGWLPRAMEGPTPSSAIFYGALSVHLGAFLLLRVEPLIALSPLLQALVVSVGLLTAIHAAVAQRAQSDIKSALAYSSLTQVGLIVAEIGLGFRLLALAHIVGNALLRTLQFLRAPSVLQDYRLREAATGRRDSDSDLAVAGESTWRQSWRERLFHIGYRRSVFEVCFRRWVRHPGERALLRLDLLERRWTAFLSGERVEPIRTARDDR